MTTLRSAVQLQALRVEWWMPRIALLGLIASLASVSIVLLATPVEAACRWDGTAPVCAGECNAGEILMERRGGGLITPFGTPGEPPYGSNCVTGTKALCCPRCPSGLVWRDTHKYDVVCVTPAERDAARNCDNYATRAVAQAQSGQACGFSGARWETNKKLHLSWCISLRGGDVNLPASETAARDQALKDCQQFCDTYATTAVAQAQENLSKKCGFPGLRWDTSYSMHFNWCKSLKGDRNLPNSERAERDNGLKYCLEQAASKAPTPGGGGQKPPPPQNACKVLLPVDVYPLPNRNNDQKRKAILAKDTQGVSLIKRDPDGWHNVKWPGNEGWAWSGKDYESLDCPQ